MINHRRLPAVFPSFRDRSAWQQAATVSNHPPTMRSSHPWLVLSSREGPEEQKYPDRNRSNKQRGHGRLIQNNLTESWDHGRHQSRARRSPANRGSPPHRCQGGFGLRAFRHAHHDHKRQAVGTIEISYSNSRGRGAAGFRSAVLLPADLGVAPAGDAERIPSNSRRSLRTRSSFACTAGEFPGSSDSCGAFDLPASCASN